MELDPNEAARLDRIEERLTRIEERIADLDRRVRHVPAARTPVVAASTVPPTDLQVDVALIGRSLIAMGGAYLLRAITDLQLVPRLAGIALGLAYAVAWIIIADRHALHGKRRTAVFDAAIGSLVLFPIVWEATVRFHAISPPVATLLVFAGSVALLVVAARRHVQTLAWMASAGTIACATGLAFDTRLISGPLVAVALVGALTWWMADVNRWRLVAWPTAIETDLLAVAAFACVMLELVHDEPASVVTALLISFGAYAIAVGWRPLVRRVDMNYEAIVQSAAIVILNLPIAARFAQRMGVAGTLLPIAILAAGLFMYIVAVGRTTDEIPVARGAFSGAAILQLLIGTAFLTGPSTAGMLWSVLAVAAAFLSIRMRARQLVLHAATYAVCAAAAAGLMLSSAQVFTGYKPDGEVFSFARAETFLAIAAATVIVIAAGSKTDRFDVRMARVVLMANAAILTIGVAAYATSEIFGGDVARDAAVRTIVVAAVAALLAWLARLPHLNDLGILVYPLLIAGGVKMLIEDFRSGRPTTLFVTLALYGALLVLVARLRSSAMKADPVSPAA